MKNSDKKKEIISKYNLTSHFYDQRYSKIQFEKYATIFENYTLDDRIILDAGCGTGLLFEFIINSTKLYENTHYFYIAADNSCNMLKIFKSKIKNNEKNIKHNINLILADLENLPFRDCAFHSIFSLTSLQNLPDIISGVKESFRVVKNDADIKFSILKKKLNLGELMSVIKPLTENLEIIDEKSLEDVIIQGKASKS